ncbi:MAG: 2-oxo-3-hexenedioate decarboxylase [Betaproteobacteria bacterium]|nr:2-oxo-3-hexenedioate decarboxylase [Betaproteobacteria bacterium]
MKLDQTTIEALAELLESCQLQARDTTKITDDHPDMDWEDAYAIQAALLARKRARGLKLAGLKAGLTSFAKMKQMGVSSPVFGWMTEDCAVPHGGEVKTSELIHPKVEPEIAFVLKRALKGPGCHMGTVLAATDFVLPGIEVIDSRYRDFKFDLKSVIADNTSAARFVVGGQPMKVDGQDLRTVGIVMEKNGQPVAFGAGAAVLGHPATAIAMLANHLGARGEEIPAGTLILSGGITEAVSVAAGDSVTLKVQGMGSTGLRFI